MIDSYRFGEIVIEGRIYTQDVLILPHRVEASWWRSEGHKLQIDDISEVVSAKPEVLVVGTGDSGLMKVMPETASYLASQGIELIVETTDKACQTFNQISASKKAVAALHLTC